MNKWRTCHTNAVYSEYLSFFFRNFIAVVLVLVVIIIVGVNVGIAFVVGCSITRYKLLFLTYSRYRGSSFFSQNAVQYENLHFSFAIASFDVQRIDR